MPSFEDRFKSFVFFHLGSDAVLLIEIGSEQVQVSLSHQRIHPLNLRLSQEEAAELARDRDGFEEYLLGLLTRHRRGQGKD